MSIEQQELVYVDNNGNTVWVCAACGEEICESDVCWDIADQPHCLNCID